MEVLGALGCEAGPVHDGGHWTQLAKVVGQGLLSYHVGEAAVAEAGRVLLCRKREATKAALRSAFGTHGISTVESGGSPMPSAHKGGIVWSTL